MWSGKRRDLFGSGEWSAHLLPGCSGNHRWPGRLTGTGEEICEGSPCRRDRLPRPAPTQPGGRLTSWHVAWISDRTNWIVHGEHGQRHSAGRVCSVAEVRSRSAQNPTWPSLGPMRNRHRVFRPRRWESGCGPRCRMRSIVSPDGLTGYLPQVPSQGVSVDERCGRGDGAEWLAAQ